MFRAACTGIFSLGIHVETGISIVREFHHKQNLFRTESDYGIEPSGEKIAAYKESQQSQESKRHPHFRVNSKFTTRTIKKKVLNIAQDKVVMYILTLYLIIDVTCH